jgi:hypothetical protein
MEAERVALIPHCAEGDVIWLPAGEDRWEAHLTDNKPPEIAFFCPDCADTEFGAR